MPFDLKNVSATHQCLVSKIFKKQIGHTIKVYIDDMITKSLRTNYYTGHLRDTFNVLKKH